MNRYCGRGLVRVAYVLAVLCTFTLILGCFAVPSALAAGQSQRTQEVYVDGVSYNHDEDGAVSTQPNDIMWDIAVGFSVNVAVPPEGADDGFIQRNMDRVHLYTADGSEVQGWHASVQGGGKRVIYIELDRRLKPLTEYQVVVDAGVEAAESDAVSTSEFRETFKTGAMCADGLSVYQNVWIVLAVVLVIAGVAVQIARVRKRRR